MLFLIFKAVFLAKLKQQMQNGRNQFVLKKLHSWIMDNLDMLYNNFKEFQNQKQSKQGNETKK